MKINHNSQFLISRANKGKAMKREQSKTAGKPLDQMDRDIICLLQKNGRLTNIIISKKLGISEATVRNRLNRLIGEDYIKIVAVSNPLKLGFEIVGIIRIEVVVQKQERVAKELEKIKSIWNIVYTTGTADINTEFVAKSLDELNDLLLDKISKIDGIIRTETSLILKYIIRNYDWGTGLD